MIFSAGHLTLAGVYMDRISCRDCGQCNRKGKPSVSRFSKYCDQHFGAGHGIFKAVKSSGFILDLKARLFERRADKETGLKSRGFRKSWFFR